MNKTSAPLSTPWLVLFIGWQPTNLTSPAGKTQWERDGCGALISSVGRTIWNNGSTDLTMSTMTLHI